MPPSGPLVTAAIVSREAGHQQLRILGADPAEEVVRLRTAQGRRPDAVMQDHDLVTSDDVLESVRCRHADQSAGKWAHFGLAT